MTAPAFTRDRPAPGVVVYQPRRGFRYGAEAFWLAGFALEGGRARTAMDLGTGSGIVAFLLARAGVDVIGVDVRPEWAPLWARSLAESAVCPALRHGDVRDIAGPRVDLVVANPPFFPAHAGPVSVDPWKAAARSETQGTVAEFMAAARRVVGEAGRVCVVVPVDREADVRAAAGAPVRRRVAVGRKRVLLEIGGGAPPCDEAIDERGPRVLGWYAATGAVPTTGPPR